MVIYIEPAFWWFTRFESLLLVDNDKDIFVYFVVCRISKESLDLPIELVDTSRYKVQFLFDDLFCTCNGYCVQSLLE